MTTLSFILINGFLFSISSSSVTTNNCANLSPVVQETCVEQKPVPLVQPAQPQQEQKPAIETKPIKEKQQGPECFNPGSC